MNKQKNQAQLQGQSLGYMGAKVCQALCMQKFYQNLIAPLYVFCGMSYENISATKCVALAHWVLLRKKYVLSHAICTSWLAGADSRLTHSGWVLHLMFSLETSFNGGGGRSPTAWFRGTKLPGMWQRKTQTGLAGVSLGSLPGTASMCVGYTSLPKSPWFPGSSLDTHGSMQSQGLIHRSEQR